MREDWVECRFEEITISLKRGPFGGDLKKAFFVQSGYPVYEQQHAINNDFSSCRYFINEERFQKLKACKVGPGDYIVSCSGTMGKIAQLPKSVPVGVINQALLRIRINEQIIHSAYFLQFFRSSLFQKEILKDSRGSGMQNMAGLKEIKPIQLDLPPLPEQRAIVSRIEALFSDLDQGIADLKKAQGQLKVYHQAVLKKAFEGNFEEVELRSLIINIQAGKSFRCEERPPKYDEVGILKVSALTWGEFQEDESKTVTDSSRIRQDYFVNDGDFLLSRANTIELVGNAVIVKNIKKNLMLSDKTLRISFDQHIDPYYVLYFLRSRDGRRQIEMLSTGNQASMRNIGQDRIKQIKLPIPPSIKEQQKIVREIESRLSVCDAVEKSISEALAKAKALRQSILKKAFEGELLTEEELASCRQEADWEPAGELLQRIKSVTSKQP